MFASTSPLTFLSLPLLLAGPTLAQYTATYDANNLPQSSEQGQYGTNACGTSSSQDSNCQNAYINSVNDFCVWGPPSTTSDEGDGTSKIGNVEQIVVSYCLKDGYGTRIIPEGTISSAHFVKVVNDKVSYVQVTGRGDFTKILIPAGDEGGELDYLIIADVVAWTGLGNPQGGLVFTDAFTGSAEQTHEWTSFMSANDFCFRACRDGPNAPGYCEHIYDVLSCSFTIPGSMDDGFDDCLGDPTDEAPGVYGGSTFHQGDPTTPAPHPAGATSQCTAYSTIGGGSAQINIAPASASASTSVITSASMNATSSAMVSSNNITSSVASTSSSGSMSTSTSTSTSMSVASISRMSSMGPSSTTSAGRSAASTAAAAAQSTGSAQLGQAISGGAIGLAFLGALLL